MVEVNLNWAPVIGYWVCYPKGIVESPTKCEGGGSHGGKAKPDTTPNSSEAVLVSQEEKQKTRMDTTTLSPGY